MKRQIYSLNSCVQTLNNFLFGPEGELCPLYAIRWSYPIFSLKEGNVSQDKKEWKYRYYKMTIKGHLHVHKNTYLGIVLSNCALSRNTTKKPHHISAVIVCPILLLQCSHYRVTLIIQLLVKPCILACQCGSWAIWRTTRSTSNWRPNTCISTKVSIIGGEWCSTPVSLDTPSLCCPSFTIP